MPILSCDLVTNEDVKSWKGLHLLNCPPSLCSSKARLCLKELGLPYTSHIVNLHRGDNFSEWFLGINPRGLVPTLVDDGRVIIETKDIIEYLDCKPGVRRHLVGDKTGSEAKELAAESSMHGHVRNLTFAFLLPPGKAKKPERYFENMRTAALREPENIVGMSIEENVEFYRTYDSEGGTINETILKVSLLALNYNFKKLNARFCAAPQDAWMSGAEEPNAVDIAWFCTVNRAVLCGYPLRYCHPNLADWFVRACERWPEEARSPVPKFVSYMLDACMSVRGTKLSSYLPGAEPSSPITRNILTVCALSAGGVVIGATVWMVGKGIKNLIK
mmetsp:Transcript_32648/g.45320  ORF Transcript_32648/g.45320 Transcript_32648/m.45320 type:complete len:331 (-) Transcript_32648:202-1194(-)|eukprot:CAMPEP_0196581778 /NCGR_PEP_ID=MMETSP1081-20130531/35521_1 /TAXON_ID=36882 /ORGANISM="Pyramimonas amylifera, Strain CCMP720" /LENGTH=330 /DNA_ID=CAMNT_0041902127 /DNA_START=120 /DNA_END=1112 /DNA_ORIENTATION=+